MLRSTFNTTRTLRRKASIKNSNFAFVRFQSDASTKDEKNNAFSIERAPEDTAARDEHLKNLQRYYPPSLIKSILAAEAHISPEQWKARKLELHSQFAPVYDDDFAKYDPLFDLARHDWVNKDEPLQPIPQQLPPGMDVIEQSNGRGTQMIDTGALEQLTGMSRVFMKKLKAKPLVTKRVVNMTRKGKQPSFYALTVVGDKEGYVGIGEGRDPDSTRTASVKAAWNAMKNLQFVPRYENRTIYGNVSNKFGSVLLELSAAPPGSGLRVNHIVYEICKACGIRDLAGHVRRSRNPMNVAKATIEALTQKQQSIEKIAASRGKKTVDITGAYYKF